MPGRLYLEPDQSACSTEYPSRAHAGGRAAERSLGYSAGRSLAKGLPPMYNAMKSAHNGYSANHGQGDAGDDRHVVLGMTSAQPTARPVAALSSGH
jgi:hypothetical protein